MGDVLVLVWGDVCVVIVSEGGGVYTSSCM